MKAPASINDLKLIVFFAITAAQYTGAVCKSAPSHVTPTDFSTSCDVSRQLGSNFDQTERQMFKGIPFRKSLSEVEFLGNH